MKSLKKKNKIEEKTPVDPNEKKASRRRLANGGYALAITAVIVAAIVVINFIVGAIPSRFTTFDVTSEKVYSIGKTTKNVLDSLKDDVTLNFLTVGGQEDETTERLLNTYAGYSSHIKVKKIDMVSNPSFASKYTESTPTMNSVIVVSGDKSKVIDYNSLYQYNMSGYSYQATAYDGEGQITSAISYVAGTEGGKIYYTTGHSEISLSTGMTDAINKSNLETGEINLLSESIPDDCSALLIFAPSSDFTADEAKKVTDYLDNGGHAMIVSLSEAVTGSAETPNFDSILSHYGIHRKGGLVLEGDSSKYVQTPYLMIPSVNTSSSVTSDMDNQNVLYPLGEALSVDDTDDDSTYTVTPILNSSANAYIKSDLTNIQSLEKEDGDETGSFPLAVQVEETSSNDSDGSSDVKEADSSTESVSSDSQAETDSDSDDSKEMKLLYFTTPAVFSADVLSSLLQVSTTLPEGNQKLFSNSITYLTDQEVSVSVEAKSLSTPMLSDGEMSTAFSSTVGNITMFLIPAVFLIAGIWVWARRRAR